MSPTPEPLDARSHAALETLTHLARVTAELTTADSIDAVSKIVTYHIADAVGATVAALALRDGDWVDVVALRGLGSREAARWERFPFDLPNPAGEAMRTGRRVVCRGTAELLSRYPGLDLSSPGERTVVSLPLRATGTVMGAITLSIPGPHDFGPAELDMLDVMADACAQAFERIEATAVARLQTARLSFLAEASIELASSLDLGVTVDRVARLAVPAFADWCAIDVLRDGSLRRMAVAHVDPEKVALAHELQERWPPDPGDTHGVWAAVRTGRTQLVPELTDEVLRASARDEEQLALARELGLRSAIITPLLVRGRAIGALTWVSTDPSRLYGEDDARFAEHLARRAATAMDNAELHSQTLAAAEQLQRAVLPDRLVTAPGWQVACEYHPSGRAEVGGDFYDAFVVDTDRHTLVLGDVMGRGVAAAAAMAQTRAAVRAFASIDPDPAVVTAKVDRMLAQFGTEQLITMLYVLADARTGVLTMTNAGHLPPLVVDGAGSARFLPLADGPPLGVGPVERSTQSETLRPGETLLAYTDGLVERRDEDLGDGLERLLAAAAPLAWSVLSEGLRALVHPVRDSTYDDDTAVIALRRDA
jgi:serine phosphatase RsbU (regulator of sigma subunit)